MHIEPPFAVPFSTYPSPPSLCSSEASYPLSDDDTFPMGTNTNVNVDGIGVLNYQRAIDIARNSEGDLDPTVSAYLETALSDIWGRINMEPEVYIMTKDEFAVFNFYRGRFERDEVAEAAVARYWAHTYDAPAPSS